MKHLFFVAPLLAIALVVMGAATLFRTGRAAPRGDTIYSASAVATDLARNPAGWTGRTILVRGDLRFAGGVMPDMMPMVILTSPPPRHITIGPIDLTRLLVSGHPGAQVTGLLLTQRPSSRQRLDFERTATYRLRLAIDHIRGRVVPVGSIV